MLKGGTVYDEPIAARFVAIIVIDDIRIGKRRGVANVAWPTRPFNHGWDFISVLLVQSLDSVHQVLSVKKVDESSTDL